jgi:RNA polymerase sigma factor (sigma-70 family)
MKRGFLADKLLKPLSAAICLLLLLCNMRGLSSAAPMRVATWRACLNPLRGPFSLVLTRGRASTRTVSNCMTPEQYDKELEDLLKDKWLEKYVAKNLSAADTADVTQEALKRVVQAKANRLGNIKTLRGYACTTVRHLQIDRAKRWDANFEYVGDQSTLDEAYKNSHGVASGPAAELLQQEREELIRKAMRKVLAELPSWQRRVVYLWRIEELSFAECAKRLHWTESSVRTAAKLAMSELRAKTSASLKELLSEESQDGV